MQVFWERGLSATSIDDLADAMRMNKPSIYNAFGGKEELYRICLDRFCRQLDAGLEATLESDLPLQKAFVAFYHAALEVYCDNEPSLGCLMICTAPVAAVYHPDIGKDLRDLIGRLDRRVAERLRKAQADGELQADIDAKQMAKLLQAVLQTIALRARAGESKHSLKKFAAFSVATIL